MHITRTLVPAVLALSVASATAAIAALACEGPKYADGTYDPATQTCHVTVVCNPPQEVIIARVTADGTTCRVKYFCCLDPQF